MRRVAEEAYYKFFELEEGSGGEYVSTIKNVVDDVVREYKQVSRHVSLLDRPPPRPKERGFSFGRFIGAFAPPSAAPRAGVMELPGPAPRVARPARA